MPHWVTALVSVVGALAGWRWLVRPVRKAYAALMLLLRQIRDAGGGVAKLTREVQSLSGALVQLATVVVEEQQQLREDTRNLTERHTEMLQLVIDLDAAVHRLSRTVGQLQDDVSPKGDPDDADRP